MLNDEQIKEQIISIYPDVAFEEGRNFITAVVPSRDLHNVAKQLKSDEKFSFDFLFCQTGVDYPEYLIVVYHIKSTKHGHSLALKAKIDDRQDPHIESVYDLWKTAEFHEREIYDLFGIKFDNHPDLRRIFLDDEWVGYPLRKDYVDEINIVEL